MVAVDEGMDFRGFVGFGGGAGLDCRYGGWREGEKGRVGTVFVWRVGEG